MKLRLEDNTLRLRLSPEEVAEFSRQGRLETVVPLGPNPQDRLVYTLERDEALVGSMPMVRYGTGALAVQLPAVLADEWTSTTEVSLRGTTDVADNQVLHILVEKDLGCKH
jgi:hypothetical protein